MNKIDSTDQSFLDSLYNTIEENLLNEQFGVEELARELGISRSQLHRQLHDLTGKSTSQVIREYRLKKAKELLEKEQATVAEVSYQVGFGSPSYFNTCFSEYFGYPPGKVKIRKAIEQKRIPFITKKNVLISASILTVLVITYFFIFPTSITSIDITNASGNEVIIAVTPFDHVKLDSSGTHFIIKEDSAIAFIGNMISEEIRENLSTYKGLIIIQENSSVQLAGMSIGEVQKSKTVTHLIKGEYWKENNEILINTKIQEVSSGSLKDLNTQKTDLNQITNAINTISTQLVKELNIEADNENSDHLYQLPTQNNEAYLLYQQGKLLCQRSGRNDIDMAINLFSDAIKLDSRFAKAYAARANAHLLSASWWGDKSSVTAHHLAQADIDRALSINPELWEALEVRGDVKFEFLWDYKGAEIDLKKAAEHNNGTTITYGWFLWVTGRYDEAVSMHKKSIQYDPLYSMLYAELGLALYLAGHKDDAFDMYKQGYRIAPDNFGMDAIMAQFLMLEDQYDSAMKCAQHATSLDPGRAPFDVPLQGMIYARMGDKENTLKIMQKMDEFELKGLKGWWGYSWAKFLMYAFLDDRAKALQSLEESIRKREVIVIVTNAWLHFYNLDSFKDEAYYKIMEEAGLYYDKYEE